MSECTTSSSNSTDQCVGNNRERGVCPVKKEYLQNVQVRNNNDDNNNNKNNVCHSNDADIVCADTMTNNDNASENSNCVNVCVVDNEHRKRQRGMNKPNDRLRSDNVSGTERPTLDGELNFFHSATLQRIKVAVKQARKVGNNVHNTNKELEVEKVARMEDISNSECDNNNICVETGCIYVKDDNICKLCNTPNDDKVLNSSTSATIHAYRECSNALPSSENAQQSAEAVVCNTDFNSNTKKCEADS